MAYKVESFLYRTIENKTKSKFDVILFANGLGMVYMQKYGTNIICIVEKLVYVWGILI